MSMWRSLAQFLTGSPRAATAEAARLPARGPVDVDGPLLLSPGAQRIATMVQAQLEGAGMAQPRQWRAYRTFVFGYVEGLADLQACNGGHPERGPRSRALAASALRLLAGGTAVSDDLVDDFTAFVASASSTDADFLDGRDSALDDYDHWSERPMSGVRAFIDAAQRDLLRLHPQPEVGLSPAAPDPRHSREVRDTSDTRHPRDAQDSRKARNALLR